MDYKGGLLDYKERLWDYKGGLWDHKEGIVRRRSLGLAGSQPLLAEFRVHSLVRNATSGCQSACAVVYQDNYTT